MSYEDQKETLSGTPSVEPAPLWCEQPVLGPSDVCHSSDSPSHSYFLYTSLPEDRDPGSFCNVLEKPRALCEKVGRAFPHCRQLEQYSARWGEGLARLPPFLPFPVPDGALSWGPSSCFSPCSAQP